MGVELRVREASARDALEVLSLRRDVLAEEAYFISRADELHTTVEQQIQHIAHLKASPSQAMFVARREGVVGFVVLQSAPYARMRHAVKLEVLVAGSARGAGVGRALMQSAITWANENPVVEKIGLSVFADNTRALALYASLGFVEEGRRLQEYKMEDGSYRDDVLLCLSTLSSA